MTDYTKFFTITGTAYWPNVHKPDERNKGYYTMAVKPDDSSIIEDLRKEKVPIKTHEAVDGEFVSMDTKFPPTVVDSQLNRIPRSVALGNGTKVNVKCKVTAYKPQSKGQTGYKLRFAEVQVTHLVPYSSTFTKVDGGYVAPEDNGEEHGAIEDEFDAEKIEY